MNLTYVKPAKNSILQIVPSVISFFLVIVALSTIPGSAIKKEKYVKKDNINEELKLADITVPITALSFTLLLLLGGMYAGRQAMTMTPT